MRGLFKAVFEADGALKRVLHFHKQKDPRRFIMELIFMLAVGVVVVILAVFGIVGGLIQRKKGSRNKLKKQVSELERRVDQLENS